MTKIYYPGLKDACRKALEEILQDIIETAREHGYAVALHGSVARDIDLVAVPWVSPCSSQAEVAEEIRAAVEKVTGFCIKTPSNPGPTQKPHGRLAWSFHLRGGPYIDLSVMPPVVDLDLSPCTLAHRPVILPE